MIHFNNDEDLEMKYFMFLITLLSPLSLSAANLSFQINGLENDNGQVSFVLFDEHAKKTFPKEVGFASCSTATQINNKTAVVHCKDVAPGNYAAFAFHDENNDGFMGHNWLGLPEEKFGYYENFHVKFIPPNFDDVSFVITAQDQNFTISLQRY